jgi:dTDP-glucose pyrophosphorylase
MIPVAGRPVAHWTLEYLKSLGVADIRIAVAERGLVIEEYVDCVFGTELNVEFLVPDNDRGVGGTLAALARETGDRAVLVILGDTYFTFSDPAILSLDEAFVLTDEVDESYRWCVAEVGEDGQLTGLQDKEPGLSGPLQALIGVYHFPNASLLQEACTTAIDELEGPIQMSAILHRVADRTPIRAIKAGRWLDCGNPDRQAVAQRSLLEQRAFNELHVDPVFGMITKRSRHVEKFVDEINYLRLLPPELAVLFPRVVDFSTDHGDPHVTLEFYGYPTLAELFVFESVDPGIWRRVFEHLLSLITTGFMDHEYPVTPDAIRSMYLDKVRTRLAAVTEPTALCALIDAEHEVVVNGQTLPALRHQWSQIEAAVDKLADSAIGGVIHGDLCFSNVLYDLRSGVCKLIDPRGSFGRAGIYGDVRYDVAKLWHSVHGLYDFITADMFRVVVDGSRIDLDIRTRPHHQHIREEFADVFYPTFDRREIALITGLLFASLPPLHFDKPERQLAMYARALQLLDEGLHGSTTKPT